jgi:DNA polymerase-3 subunit alpha
MPEFIHLHNHTHFSLLDAISTIDGLVKAAAENNMKAVAITDHGVMYGAMEFYKKCKAKGVKPIIGCEVYVAQSGTRHEKGKKETSSVTDEVTSDSSDGLSSANINYAHLVLLAKNETGYKNLIKIVSVGHTEGYYYKPRVDLEILRKYNEGIVALSACAGGVISCYITRNDIPTAKKMVQVYKEIYGEDFYLEIQDHETIPAEKKVLEWMPKLAKEFDIKLIATNDCHYIKPEHAVAHNIYLHLSAKQSKFNDGLDVTRDLRYGTSQVYFKSAEEMCELFKDYPEAIQSTLEVADKCNLELDLSKNFMPRFPIPEGEKVKTLEEYLEVLSYRGMKERVRDITPEAEERLKYELSVINKMDFAGYFLIVQDFIAVARSKGILVGPGRGSAAGSLVCYCLGITDVNPLEYNLFFERFLNPARISMPDIDIDFQDDRREEVIQYAKDKYGESSVAQIITFNKLAPRGVLKDVGRVLNFPFQEINDLTKHIPILFGKVKPLGDTRKEVPEFNEYFESGDAVRKEEKKKLFDYSTVLENLNKNSSIHASGIVIAPGDVTDYVPLSKVTGEENVFCTQYDMNQLEDAGLIKIDFLGLKELKVINKIFALVEKRYGRKLTTAAIPLDDEKTYDLFSAGSTIGIFQFSKSKMREYLAKLKPRNIHDLAAMNALYRPGPMKLIPDFIDKRFGRKQISVLHPKMESALQETYGIIVYQEQVMQIARDLAGFSMAEADNMRKAMGKKIKEKMQQIKDDFIKGAVKNDVPRKTAAEIFNLILDFADYGFNKSHAVAYSILAFYTAYLKTHYPVEFLAVSMACRKDSETELQELADECKKMKVKLCPPSVNTGEVDFTTKYSDKDDELGEIIYGLSAIKNVGEKAVQNIIDEREANGPYKSFMDFLKRVDLRLVNRKTLEGLIFAGAFDELEPKRRKLFLNLERATAYAQRYKDKPESKGQEGLFGGGDDTAREPEDNKILEDYDEFPEVEKFNSEKAAIGFYLTGHPLAKYEEAIGKFITLSFGEDVNELDFRRLENISMCGVISDLQIKTSKKGNKFAVFNLVDFEGSGECVAFGKVYEQRMGLFKNNNLVFVEGRAEENGDKIKLTVDDICPIESIYERYAENLTIYLDKNNGSLARLEELHPLVEKYSDGRCRLFFKEIDKNGFTEKDKDLWISQKYRIVPKIDFVDNLIDKKIIFNFS